MYGLSTDADESEFIPLMTGTTNEQFDALMERGRMNELFNQQFFTSHGLEDLFTTDASEAFENTGENDCGFNDTTSYEDFASNTIIRFSSFLD